jgi:hypothetical protein
MNLDLAILLTAAEYPNLDRGELSRLASKLYVPEEMTVYLAAIDRLRTTHQLERTPTYGYSVTDAGLTRLGGDVDVMSTMIERYRALRQRLHSY